MSQSPNQTSSNLEKEYIQLKRRLSEKYFTYAMIVFLVNAVIGLIKAVMNSKSTVLFNSGFNLLIGIIVVKLKNKWKKHLDLIIVVFSISLYIVSMIIHYYMNVNYFESSFDAFYFGYTCAGFEKISASRTANFSHRTLFRISAFFARVLLIPFVVKEIIIMHFFCLIVTIYLDFEEESYDKNLFGSYFHSKEQLNKFKDLLVDDIPEGIVIVSHEDIRCLFVNNSFKELVNTDNFFNIKDELKNFQVREPLTSCNNLINKNFDCSNQTLLTILEDKFCSLKQSLKQKYSFHVSYNKSTSASTEVEKIFEAKITNIVWDELPAIAIILHDITQEHTILQLQVAADANKDRILATVSHELRTPLNGILGMIQIMLKKIKDPELLQYLGICKNSANLLLGLVNSILDLNQIRANKFKLYPEKVFLQELLKEILSLFEFQCLQKSIFLKLQISSKSPKFLLTDRNRLSQIFINLIGNALKFTNKGGITISVRESYHQEMIELSVEDTGLGIKENDKSKLFQMFGRLEQDNKQINQQGVGLGLTISDNLAKLLCDDHKMSGIRVKSEYGKGSTFSFLIKKSLTESFEDINNETQGEYSYFSMNQSFFQEPKGIGERLKSYATLPPKRLSELDRYCSFVPEIEDYNQKVNILCNNDKNPISLFYSTQLVTNNTIPTILIVDDNPFNLTVATQLILPGI